MHDLNATTQAATTVRLELDGRPALLRDLQRALDTFRAEGISDQTEISFHQSEERGGDRSMPYEERPITHHMWIEAKRAAVTPTREALAAMAR